MSHHSQRPEVGMRRGNEKYNVGDESEQNDFLEDENCNHECHHGDDGDDDEVLVDKLPTSLPTLSSKEVIDRIESLVTKIVLEQLANFQPPKISVPNDASGAVAAGNTTTSTTTSFCRSFSHLAQCRNVTSVLLIASFCHELLLSKRTTTIRDLFYHFITHFRNQRECDNGIWDLMHVLQIPSRQSLGLIASPKGWFCGCIDLYTETAINHGENTGAITTVISTNCRGLNVHGLPIDLGLAADMGAVNYVQSNDAKCILVIEKEGIYNRLSEDKFFLNYYPCILITGKGFPDLATRRFVRHLKEQLQLPIYGLCDCNPYGVSILQSYQYSDDSSTQSRRNNKNSAAGHEPSSLSSSDIPIQWLGLRPSHIESMQDDELPPNVFQQLTSLDYKKLGALCSETNPFHGGGTNLKRLHELELMRELGFKIELEALNWKGMDYLCHWLRDILIRHERRSELGLII